MRIGRKLSKIETLTLAKNYIKALTNVICEMRGECAPYEISEKGQHVEEPGGDCGGGDEGVDDDDGDLEGLMSSSIRSFAPSVTPPMLPRETGTSRRRRRRLDDDDRVSSNGGGEDMSEGEENSIACPTPGVVPPASLVAAASTRTLNSHSVLVSDGFGGHFLTSDRAPLDDPFSTRAASIAAQNAMS